MCALVCWYWNDVRYATDVAADAAEVVMWCVVPLLYPNGSCPDSAPMQGVMSDIAAYRGMRFLCGYKFTE